MIRKLKKHQRVAVSLFIILITFMLLGRLQPTQFDIFGILIFSFLIYIGNKELRTKREMSDNTAFIIYLIGILGLIVDGMIVLKTYGGLT